MGTRVCGIVAVAAVALLPGSAEAQIYLGPEIAIHDDANVGVGAALELDLPSIGPEFGLFADFLVFFPDGDQNYFEINGNLTYDFPLEGSSVVPFLLGGLNFGRVSGEFLGEDFSDSDLGLNLGGGIEFDLGSLRPSAGVRATVGGGDAVIVFGYVPFAVGG